METRRPRRDPGDRAGESGRRAWPGGWGRGGCALRLHLSGRQCPGAAPTAPQPGLGLPRFYAEKRAGLGVGVGSLPRDCLSGVRPPWSLLPVPKAGVVVGSARSQGVRPYNPFGLASPRARRTRQTPCCPFLLPACGRALGLLGVPGHACGGAGGGQLPWADPGPTLGRPHRPVLRQRRRALPGGPPRGSPASRKPRGEFEAWATLPGPPDARAHKQASLP